MIHEAHVTVSRDGLFDPQPLRTFKVATTDGGDQDVTASVVNQTEQGALLFITLRGGLSFVTRAYAAGQWRAFEGSLPTDDEVRSIRVFSERERAINAMLMHDGRAQKH